MSSTACPVEAAPVLSALLSVAAPTKYGDVDAMAFDDAGNLWLGHYQLNTATEVAAAGLAAAGNPSPTVVISLGGLYGSGLAFDPHSSALPLH